MTEAVVFDAWAWLEVLDSSPQGRRLVERYLRRGTVHSVDITLAEVSLRYARAGREGDIPAIIDGIVDAMRLTGGSLLRIEAEDAKVAGPLRRALRVNHKDASLTDAVLLGVARNRGIRLVSADAAYRGLADVVSE